MSDPSSSSTLCNRCQTIDWSPLIDPLPAQPSPCTIEELASEREVFLNNFHLSAALTGFHCHVCRLITRCASSAGLFADESDSSQPTSAHSSKYSSLVTTRCRLRPRIVWKSYPAATEGSPDTPRSVLEHSGKIHVWFYKCMGNPKWIPPKLPEKPIESTPQESVSSDPNDGDTSLGKVDGSQTSSDAPEITRNPDRTLDGAPDPAPPTASHRPSASRQRYIDSAVASWTIDIIDAGVDSAVAKRRPRAENIDVGLLREWLQTCDGSHQHAAQVVGISVPLAQLPICDCLRAINTTTGRLAPLAPSESFVALSYVWGRTTPVDICMRQMGSPLEGMPVADYPATIRDAAVLSRNLGFDWLWVDRICIDQSNETESALMIPYVKDIFAAAKLTLVAACGDGVHCGLPGIGGTKRAAEQVFNVQLPSQMLQMVPSAVSFNAMLEDSTWRTRGWTFEEHVFSKRLLYVFPTEVFLSCAQGTFRETTETAFTEESAGSIWGDGGRTPPSIAAELHSKFHDPAARQGLQLTLREYVRAVQEYTSRGLTVEEDRVKAFAGLIAAATPVYSTIQDESLLLHGQPLKMFETLLTWHHEEGEVPRPSKYGRAYAPSWSWASAGTKVYFLDSGEEHTRCQWFRYRMIGGFDVLGLPVAQDNPFVRSLNLKFPDEIICDEPWEGWIPIDPPGYEETQTTVPAHGKALSLPMLHLLTIIFDATFYPGTDGLHSIRAIGSSTGSRVRITGRWSMGAEEPIDPVETQRGCAASDFSKNSCEEDGRRHTFAIVAGYNHMYIMLLKSTEERDTFSRLGLLRVSLYGNVSRSILQVMSKGGARWEYIRIV